MLDILHSLQFFWQILHNFAYFTILHILQFVAHFAQFCIFCTTLHIVHTFANFAQYCFWSLFFSFHKRVIKLNYSVFNVVCGLSPEMITENPQNLPHHPHQPRSHYQVRHSNDCGAGTVPFLNVNSATIVVNHLSCY